MYLTGFPQLNVLAVLDAGRNPRKPVLRLRPREKIQPLLYRLPVAHRNRANVPLSNVNQAGHLSGDVCFFQLSFLGVFFVLFTTEDHRRGSHILSTGPR